jgi:BirA family biotin operon repressor/biotin-[acetyl-CoA-carboxylase] ligase
MTELSLQAIEKAIDFPFDHLAYFPSIGSTNDAAGEWADAWAETGQEGFGLALADEQTAGRGRSGRTWFTPPGAALALTMLLPPVYDADLAGRLAGMAAVAVSQAFEKGYGLEAQIKWPNDVLLNGAKCVGILPEARWRGQRLGGHMVGIGINIAPGSVPPAESLNFPATSMESVLGERVDRLELLSAVVSGLLGWYERLGSPGLLSAWEKRLAYLHERIVLFDLEGQEEARGVVRGLAEDGRLRLELENGAETLVRTGEIHLRPLVDS